MHFYSLDIKKPFVGHTKTFLCSETLQSEHAAGLVYFYSKAEEIHCLVFFSTHNMSCEEV